MDRTGIGPADRFRVIVVGGGGTGAAISREIEKGAGPAEDLLALAAGGRGVWLCERAVHCSKVCATEVYPARHIHRLRQRLEAEGES